MTRKNNGNLPEQTKIIAPNHSNGSRENAIIIDNLTLMYFVKYESGSTGFIFKSEHIEVL